LLAAGRGLQECFEPQKTELCYPSELLSLYQKKEEQLKPDCISLLAVTSGQPNTLTG
jgi:hypothetical protein